MNNRCFFIFIFCFTMVNGAVAQSPARIESDLLKQFNKISYWYQHREKAGADDSLVKANDNFAKTLQYITPKFPGTISLPFESLVKNGLTISSSDDGQFRIYSWDTETGGTMHFFENVFQYKAGTKSNAVIDSVRSEGDNRPNYSKVYTFRNGAKSYYLAVFMYIGSSKDFSEGLQIFGIDKGKLNDDVKLIKTKTGLHSQLAYDFENTEQLNWDTRPEVHFDAATNTIFLPLVDGNYHFTKKYICYRFNGQFFEKVKG